MKSFLQINNIEMYSRYNEEKSVAAEYMTPISKNVYIDKLDDAFNKYNGIHTTEQLKWNLLT